MSDVSKGQVSTDAAEVYDEFFLPALIEQWPSRVAEAAQIQPGQDVLDVACGTGVLTREVATRVKPGGSVVGLDINEGMLAVAALKAPHIKWELAPAESLPFADSQFDRVVSQFGLMFFEDRRKSVSEMLRVLNPGGRVAVAVWASLETTPGYAAITELLEKLFGAAYAEGLRSPYCLGNTEELSALFIDAGAPSPEVQTLDGTARFPSLESWIFTDVKGWTLADMITDQQYETLQQEARPALSQFVLADGSVVFSAPAHIVIATKA